MLRAARKPLPSPLTTANQVATWVDGWAVHQLSVGFPVPPSVGQWLIRQGLYARGTDFTSGFADQLGYAGHSTLKELWSSHTGSRTEGMAGLHIYVLTRRDIAQGVVCYAHADTPENPTHAPKERLPVARLGHVMAFLKKPYRKQGLVRRTVQDFVLPHAETLAEQCVRIGVMPVLGGSAAMAKMLKTITALPLVTDLTVCRGMRDEVWSMVNRARMYPERKHPSGRYLAMPQPVPPATKKRVRAVA